MASSGGSCPAQCWKARAAWWMSMPRPFTAGGPPPPAARGGGRAGGPAGGGGGGVEEDEGGGARLGQGQHNGPPGTAGADHDTLLARRFEAVVEAHGVDEAGAISVVSHQRRA